MIIDNRLIQQDTLRLKKLYLQDTTGIKANSSLLLQPEAQKDTIQRKVFKTTVQQPVPVVDTTSVCYRNNISDVTFFDSTNFILKQNFIASDNFPFRFTEINKQSREESRLAMISHLKSGINLPLKPLHEDWITGILIVVAFLFAVVRTTSKNIVPGITRFFLFRGINDPSSRDLAGIFYWQSTILNLISFVIVSLFAYSAASWAGAVPEEIPGIISWLISFAAVVVTVTLRHIVCMAVGVVSGEKEVFNEYLFGVYQSYRFGAIFLFTMVFLISYTLFFPPEKGLITGAVIFLIMYLFRIMRLFIIFLNRNISIFYLILYLCALEIMPVLISLKFFSGLI